MSINNDIDNIEYYRNNASMVVLDVEINSMNAIQCNQAFAYIFNCDLAEFIRDHPFVQPYLMELDVDQVLGDDSFPFKKRLDKNQHINYIKSVYTLSFITGKTPNQAVPWDNHMDVFVYCLSWVCFIQRPMVMMAHNLRFDIQGIHACLNSDFAKLAWISTVRNSVLYCSLFKDPDRKKLQARYKSLKTPWMPEIQFHTAKGDVDALTWVLEQASGGSLFNQFFKGEYTQDIVQLPFPSIEETMQSDGMKARYYANNEMCQQDNEVKSKGQHREQLVFTRISWNNNEIQHLSANLQYVQLPPRCSRYQFDKPHYLSIMQTFNNDFHAILHEISLITQTEQLFQQIEFYRSEFMDKTKAIKKGKVKPVKQIAQNDEHARIIKILRYLDQLPCRWNINLQVFPYSDRQTVNEAFGRHVILDAACNVINQYGLSNEHLRSFRDTREAVMKLIWYNLSQNDNNIDNLWIGQYNQLSEIDQLVLSYFCLSLISEQPMYNEYIQTGNMSSYGQSIIIKFCQQFGIPKSFTQSNSYYNRKSAFIETFLGKGDLHKLKFKYEFNTVDAIIGNQGILDPFNSHLYTTLRSIKPSTLDYIMPKLLEQYHPDSVFEGVSYLRQEFEFMQDPLLSVLPFDQWLTNSQFMKESKVKFSNEYLTKRSFHYQNNMKIPDPNGLFLEKHRFKIITLFEDQANGMPRAFISRLQNRFIGELVNECTTTLAQRIIRVIQDDGDNGTWYTVLCFYASSLEKFLENLKSCNHQIWSEFTLILRRPCVFICEKDVREIEFQTHWRRYLSQMAHMNKVINTIEMPYLPQFIKSSKKFAQQAKCIENKLRAIKYTQNDQYEDHMLKLCEENSLLFDKETGSSICEPGILIFLYCIYCECITGMCVMKNILSNSKHI